MSSRSSARVCITFKAGQRSALGRISRESGAPFAELVRRAVDSFVEAHAAGFDQLETDPGETTMTSLPISTTTP
jgi:hypothetical protein